MALILTLAATLLAAAVGAAPANAGCAICDQYTLDIPDPQTGGEGFSEPSAPEPAPEPEPAPAPAPAPAAAPAEPAATDDYVAPETTAAPEQKDEEKKRKPKPDPMPPFPVQVDGPPDDSKYLASTPLSYEGEDSASGAALAGLGSPGTLALLAALFAGGAAIAIGRRRSSSDA